MSLRPAIFVLLILAAALMGGFIVTGCSPSAGPENEVPSFSQRQNPGVAANDLMSDSLFTELLVEIDYMEGFRPDERALDSLKAFLERRLHKTTITIQEPSVIPSGNRDSYSATEIRSLEEEHRDEYTDTEDDPLTVYMIIVDGTFSQFNVLGIAYYNTSNAFFGAAYEQASGGLAQPSRYLMEAISFRHEMGHLLGLVNIPQSGTEMQQEHQDEENGHHCDNDQCLMYYAMESTDLFGQFVGEEIPALDQNCLLDLQANGGR